MRETKPNSGRHKFAEQSYKMKKVSEIVGYCRIDGEDLANDVWVRGRVALTWTGRSAGHLCAFCAHCARFLPSEVGDIQLSKNVMLDYQDDTNMAGVGILGLGGRWCFIFMGLAVAGMASLAHRGCARLCAFCARCARFFFAWGIFSLSKERDARLSG